MREYLLDLNGTQAAIRAGYSPNTAAAIASEVLALPKVAKAVAAGRAQRAERLNITQDKVLASMTMLAESSVNDYVADETGNVHPAPGAPNDCIKAIKSIKRRFKTITRGSGESVVVEKTCDVEIQLWDKPGTLKLVGKHIGLFPDRVEHTGKDGAPIAITEVRSIIVDPATGGYMLEPKKEDE